MVEEPSTDRWILVHPLALQDQRAEHFRGNSLCDLGFGCLWGDLKSDINRDSIAAYAPTLGLQEVAMISVDEDLSAQRLKIV